MTQKLPTVVDESSAPGGPRVMVSKQRASGREDREYGSGEVDPVVQINQMRA
ncbi:hypothetical protein ACLQ25_13700 [Micromonospora sp. DT44]|uniref:hypothetical protein n=1 Tax=Micromonospora sp. DT44 TaxID=3393439 RepID=UPI003CF44EAC